MGRTSLRAIAMAASITCLICGIARADWTDTFDNNSYDQPTWTFFSSPSGGTASIVDVAATTDDYLQLGGGSGIVIGGGLVLGESFTNVGVSGWVNEKGDNVGAYNLTDHLLLARTTLTSGVDGYGLILDWELDGIELNVIKFDDGSPTAGGTPVMFFTDTANLDQRLWVQLSVVGSTNPVLTGRVFDAPSGTLLGTATYTDNSGTPYLSGFSGIGAVADGTSGYTGTFDNITSVVPEPTSALLLMISVGSLGMRRRSDTR